MNTLLETIVRDLGELPPPKLVEVSHFIHSLRPSAEETARRREALRLPVGPDAGHH